ncbi:GNAT family N-acetyltransferase [Asticcacaulis solisilvae]|uniref:GNAT family N-acetyltransferase n=1 Tax=Asticcacaulis solisilvae TaxID=1217274 RepID=UPI003FD734A6
MLPFERLSPSLKPRQDGFGNAIGQAIPDWQGCHRLPDVAMTGRTCTLLPYGPALADGLFEAFSLDDGGMWTYLPYGPFASAGELADSVETYQRHRDFQTFVIVKNERPLGFASYMRYDCPNGSVEVGGVTFSPALRRSVVATEAMYLMMKAAFDHGYRRYEWKCDQLNRPSNLAALRLGFQFEGVFRNATVPKGRRRDTAWYSVIVEDWPGVKARLEAWLDPENFDEGGRQRQSLSTLPLSQAG